MNLIIEIFGYVASGFVAISLLMVSLIKLRILNLIGCLFFVMYGFFLGAWPIVVTNGFIAGINVVFLYKMFRQDISRFIYQPLESSDADIVVRFLSEKVSDCNKFYPFFHTKMIAFAFSQKGSIYGAFKSNRVIGLSVLLSIDSLLKLKPNFWSSPEIKHTFDFQETSEMMISEKDSTRGTSSMINELDPMIYDKTRQEDFFSILESIPEEKKTSAYLMPADYLTPKYRDIGVVGRFHTRLLHDVPAHVKRIICPVFRKDAGTRRYFQRNGYEKLMSKGDYTIFELDLEDLRSIN